MQLSGHGLGITFRIWDSGIMTSLKRYTPSSLFGGLTKGLNTQACIAVLNRLDWGGSFFLLFFIFSSFSNLKMRFKSFYLEGKGIRTRNDIQW